MPMKFPRFMLCVILSVALIFACAFPAQALTIVAPGTEKASATAPPAEFTEASIPDVTSTPEVSAEPIQSNTPRYGKTNTSGANVRAKASAKAERVVQLKNTGTAVSILEETKNDSETWYYVEVGSRKGYIRSDLVDEISEAEATELIAKANSTNKPSSSGSSSRNSSGGSSSSNPSSGGSSPKQGQTVYISSSGKKYHRSSRCSNMRSPSAVTLEQAQSSGRTRCSKCW